eukprot:6453869-Alexandrium_andersonii.AAC.1
MRAGAEAFVYELVATPGLAVQGRGSPKVVSRRSGAGSLQELIGVRPTDAQERGAADICRSMSAAGAQKMLWKVVSPRTPQTRKAS